MKRQESWEASEAGFTGFIGFSGLGSCLNWDFDGILVIFVIGEGEV